jgi:methane/ammonia monooxygenase subunit B
MKVGELVTITGKFIPSEHWPKHLGGVEDAVYLNVGVPGPTFIRLESSINGVPMIRSTSLEKGKLYEFEMQLRARIPGNYHLHPLLNVRDVGTLVGKGAWVRVEDIDEPVTFVNEVETMQGEVIDLETYGVETVKIWHAIWIVLGLAYLVFWLIRREMFIPRYMQTKQAIESGENPNDIITRRDFMVTAGFFTVTLTLILTGYLYTDYKYPLTIPLQTGNVSVTGIDIPAGPLRVDLNRASYELGGRSLTLEMQMTNSGLLPIQLTEFATANIRFMNPEAPATMPVYPDEEMVAANGLEIANGVIEPGQTIDVKLVASDSLWETQRMTGLIHAPDSRFAGLLFYQDTNGEQYFQEVGGTIVPSFF